VERIRSLKESDPSVSSALATLTAKLTPWVATRTWRARGKHNLEADDEAVLQELVQRLGKLNGVPMKLGQLIGFLELDLPDEMRQLFAVLQTQSQSTPFEVVKTIVRADLGNPAEGLIAAMDPSPVSIASIGQVHRARLGGRPVAVKVRHPLIEESIRSDSRAPAPPRSRDGCCPGSVRVHASS